MIAAQDMQVIFQDIELYFVGTALLTLTGILLYIVIDWKRWHD